MAPQPMLHNSQPHADICFSANKAEAEFPDVETTRLLTFQGTRKVECSYEEQLRPWRNVSEIGGYVS